MWEKPLRRCESGSGLPETIFALVISAVAIASGFLVNSYQLKLVKSARETSAASGALEERVEQLRTATWRQITDANYLSTTYFPSPVRSVDALPKHSEYIAIHAWPDIAAATPLVMEKQPGNSPELLSDGNGLASQRLAKVDVRISWVSKDARWRTREITTVISNGGISRMNLPGMGSGSGSPGATPAPTPTPGNSGNGNGNENNPGNGSGSGSNPGRGDVGGKPGKN